MTTTRNLTANATVNTYDINYVFKTQSGTTLTGVTNSNRTTYTFSTSAQNITLTNPSKTGYTFVSWSASGATISGTTLTIAASKTGDITVTGTFKEATYTIAYVLNGGTNASGNPTSFTFSTSSQTLTVNNPTRTGYTFSSWTVSSGASISGTTLTINANTASNITLTANWSANVITITLNNQSATTSGEDYIYYRFGTNTYYTTNSSGNLSNAVTAISLPAKTGYTFGGYYTLTNGDGTQYISQAGTFANNLYSSVSSNTTLYAKWTANRYKITFNANGGDFVGGLETVYAVYGTTNYYTTETGTTTVLKTHSVNGTFAVPYRDGYTFLGYGTTQSGGVRYITYSQANATTGNVFSVSNWQNANDTILYAQWQLNSASISYDYAGGSASGNPSSFTINTNAFTINNPTRTGYTFTGWKVTYSNLEWHYGFSVNSAPGTISNESYPYSYRSNWILLKAGVNYTFTNSANNDYRIRMWDASTGVWERNVSGNSTSFSYTSNKDVYAFVMLYSSTNNTQAIRNSFTITSSATVGTSFTVTPAKTFSGVSFPNPFGTVCDISLTATWSAKTITVTLNKQNGTGGTSYIYYKYPTATYYSDNGCTSILTSVTAPSRAGYTFAGYYTSANRVGTQYVTAGGAISSSLASAYSSNVTLYAGWTANSYLVTLTSSNTTTSFSSGGTFTTASKTQTVSTGSTVVLYAKPNSGYTFSEFKVTSGSASLSAITNSSGVYSVTASGYTSAFTVQAVAVATTYNVNIYSYYKVGNNAIGAINSTTLKNAVAKLGAIGNVNGVVSGATLTDNGAYYTITGVIDTRAGSTFSINPTVISGWTYVGLYSGNISGYTANSWTLTGNPTFTNGSTTISASKTPAINGNVTLSALFIRNIVTIHFSNSIGVTSSSITSCAGLTIASVGTFSSNLYYNVSGTSSRIVWGTLPVFTGVKDSSQVDLNDGEDFDILWRYTYGSTTYEGDSGTAITATLPNTSSLNVSMTTTIKYTVKFNIKFAFGDASYNVNPTDALELSKVEMVSKTTGDIITLTADDFNYSGGVYSPKDASARVRTSEDYYIYVEVIIKTGFNAGATVWTQIVDSTRTTLTSLTKSVSGSTVRAGSTTAANGFTVTSNRDFEIVVPARTYAITLNANGGSVSPSSVNIYYWSNGIYTTTFPTATRSNYTLTGWYTEANAGQLVLTSTGSTVSNVNGYTDSSRRWIKTSSSTLYAHWQANTYTITLSAPSLTAAGSYSGWTYNSSSKTYTKSVYYGQALGTLPIPYRSGNSYLFEGWYPRTSEHTVTTATGSHDSCGTAITSSTTVTGNKTYYACWTRQYTVSYNLNGGTLPSGTSNPTYVPVNATVPTPTPTKTDSEFLGWYSNYNFEELYTTTEPGSTVTTWRPAGTLYSFSYSGMTYNRSIGSGSEYNLGDGIEGIASFTFKTTNTQSGTATLKIKFDTLAGGYGIAFNTDRSALASYLTELQNPFLEFPPPDSGGSTLVWWGNDTYGGDPGSYDTLISYGTVDSYGYASMCPTITLTLEANKTYTYYFGWTGQFSGNMYLRFDIPTSTNAPSYTSTSQPVVTTHYPVEDYSGLVTSATTMGAANRTLYAVWNTNVVLDANGGTIPSTSGWNRYTSNTIARKALNFRGNRNGTNVSSAPTVGTLPTPTRSGYSFQGWYNSAGEKLTTSFKLEEYSNAYFSARWSGASYTVTLSAPDADGYGSTWANLGSWKGSTSAKTATKSISAGGTYGTMPTPTQSGHVFMGWNRASDGTGVYVTSTTTLVTNASHTLYAVWGAGQYTVTFDINGGSVSSLGSGLTNLGSGRYSFNAARNVNYKVSDLIKVTKSGDEFATWRLNGGNIYYDSGSTFTNLAESGGSVVFTAVYWGDAYTVDFNGVQSQLIEYIWFYYWNDELQQDETDEALTTNRARVDLVGSTWVVTTYVNAPVQVQFTLDNVNCYYQVVSYSGFTYAPAMMGNNIVEFMEPSNGSSASITLNYVYNSGGGGGTDPSGDCPAGGDHTWTTRSEVEVYYMCPNCGRYQVYGYYEYCSKCNLNYDAPRYYYCGICGWQN